MSAHREMILVACVVMWIAIQVFVTGIIAGIAIVSSRASSPPTEPRNE